jgi:hypothetical protein
MSPALRALIDADAARPGPSDSQRRAVYAALGVSLGLAPVAATVTAASAAAAPAATTTAGSVASGAGLAARLALFAKAPLATVSAGVVLGAAITTYVASAPKTPPKATPTTAAVTAPAVVKKAAPTPPALDPAPVEPTPVIEAPKPRVHAPASLDERHTAPTERRAAPAHEEAPAPARPANVLGAEQALLDPARAALARGDGKGALALLDQHARRFPDGALAQEREAMTIHALVRAGEPERARGRADAFHARYPDSLLWPMIESTLGATLRSH